MRRCLPTLLLFFCVLLGGAALAQGTDACPTNDADYLAPRLAEGERARVLAGIALNLRPTPSTAQARLGVVPAGTTFTVLAGPECADGYVWWQTEYGGRRGWLAEGDPRTGDYWLEPRGQRVQIETDAGATRWYVQTADGFLEPEGCLRPPDDYTRVQLGYATLNTRTLAMLDQAQRVYEMLGGDFVTFRQLITQGSYNSGGVAASFGTHDGGGAVDISVRSYLDWSVMWDEIPLMIEALRTAGFAAWVRDADDDYLDWVIHIHAIAIGDAEASPIAQQQVNGPFGYLRGFDGLPREDGDYHADRHGGPIVCAWMLDMGFSDLREVAP